MCGFAQWCRTPGKLDKNIPLSHELTSEFSEWVFVAERASVEADERANKGGTNYQPPDYKRFWITVHCTKYRLRWRLNSFLTLVINLTGWNCWMMMNKHLRLRARQAASVRNISNKKKSKLIFDFQLSLNTLSLDHFWNLPLSSSVRVICLRP